MLVTPSRPSPVRDRSSTPTKFDLSSETASFQLAVVRKPTLTPMVATWYFFSIAELP
jgi:hypothetical protein